MTAFVIILLITNIASLYLGYKFGADRVANAMQYALIIYNDFLLKKGYCTKKQQQEAAQEVVNQMLQPLK